MSVGSVGSVVDVGGSAGVVKTVAAVMKETSRPWELVELTVDPPRAHEVLVRYVASGLCHSDEHLRTDDEAYEDLHAGKSIRGIIVS